MPLPGEHPISISDLKNPPILREVYRDQGLSLGEIARIVETTKSHVHYYMAEFNIERRLWTGLTHKRNPNLILEPYRDNSG